MRTILATALALCVLVGLAACGDQAPVPLPSLTGTETQGAGTPGPSVLPGGPSGSAPASASMGPSGGSPPPSGASPGPECAILGLDEVEAVTGGKYLPGATSGAACIFQGDPAAGNEGLVSVAAVVGDVIETVRGRFPDGQDVAWTGGKAFWSPGVGTLWVVVEGPRTLIVTILGTDLAPADLLSRAESLAQRAIGRLPEPTPTPGPSSSPVGSGSPGPTSSAVPSSSAAPSR
ncbi:MAG: hypothetical protein QOH61_2085 [Chloroflexota bacterium]|nr:hypothetical protein [Chloroflexota bacterium]